MSSELFTNNIFENSFVLFIWKQSLVIYIVAQITDLYQRKFFMKKGKEANAFDALIKYLITSHDEYANRNLTLTYFMN